MSVFTTLMLEDVHAWLRDFAIGDIVELKGIAAGITNTNYFVVTANARYVLTIFEKNDLDELPYFVDLMTFLAKHDVPCPAPIRDKNGIALHTLKGKPALMVSCLHGRDVESPNLAQCVAVAQTLAHMHVAGLGFRSTSHNQRGANWRNQTAQQVLPKLTADEAVLLKTELAFQAGLNLNDCPHGVIHGDLFRDNVLFDGDKLGGFIDFYYACHDVIAYDVAIAVNEWCINTDGAFDAEKLENFLTAYQQVRLFTDAELHHWPALLRRAGLRFWLSRLYDFHFPATGELTHAKDPDHFKNILKNRIEMASELDILEPGNTMQLIGKLKKV
ncbi:MAG: homoserine kinase [Pseudomonadota bacterium]